MGSPLIDGTPTCAQAFLEERIVYAAENIGKYVISTIRDNDVILTFGSSPLVRKVSDAIRSYFQRKVLWLHVVSLAVTATHPGVADGSGGEEFPPGGGGQPAAKRGPRDPHRSLPQGALRGE